MACEQVLGVSTRLVRPGDADALMEIYNVEVLDSTVTMDLVPRRREEQVAWVAAHRKAHAAIVAVEEGPDGEDILGFASLSPWRDRPAYAGTVENSVYVSRRHHRRRIGTLLLGELLVIARDSGFHGCMARIADGNEASIRLHATRGFELVGVEREVGRKFNRWIDVTVMQILM